MSLDSAVARESILVCLLMVAASTGTGQCPVNAGPGFVFFENSADSFNLRWVEQIYILGDNVSFRATQDAGEGRPNFLVVSPSSGVAPGSVWIALNRNVVPFLPPGRYAVRLDFAASGQSSCSSVLVTLTLTPRPAPAITSVGNAATLQPAISPGELVTILGTNLSTPPISAQYGAAGLYPTSLGNTTLTFNGRAAALLYVSSAQINAVVPYGIAGQRAADVVVTHNAVPSVAASVPVSETSPGVFTANGSGNGPGAILNADSSPNSAANPARKGSVIQIFATGGGAWQKNPPDGALVLSGAMTGSLVAPLSLTIGGKPAQIQYSGAAPLQVAGLLQVNAVVPDGIESGPQPVVLTIGPNSNVQQQVTVAVQ